MFWKQTNGSYIALVNNSRFEAISIGLVSKSLNLAMMVATVAQPRLIKMTALDT